jgi:hypothetical protein
MCSEVSGEDMMEVLAHDIMRYETLPEQSYLFVLASALAGNALNCKFLFYLKSLVNNIFYR